MKLINTTGIRQSYVLCDTSLLLTGGILIYNVPVLWQAPEFGF
jgi:hypothetical protein